MDVWVATWNVGVDTGLWCSIVNVYEIMLNICAYMHILPILYASIFAHARVPYYPLVFASDIPAENGGLGSGNPLKDALLATLGIKGQFAQICGFQGNHCFFVFFFGIQEYL